MYRDPLAVPIGHFAGHLAIQLNCCPSSKGDPNREASLCHIIRYSYIKKIVFC